MVKYFCDICGKELDLNEIHFCYEMIGGRIMYCHKHVPEWVKENSVWVKQNNEGKHLLDNSSGRK